MKKSYQKPSVKVVNAAADFNILAASNEAKVNVFVSGRDSQTEEEGYTGEESGSAKSFNWDE